MTAINAAIAFFAVFVEQNEELLATMLNKSLNTSRHSISNALASEIEEVRSISQFASLVSLIERKASIDNIKELKQMLKLQRFHSYLILAANGQVILENEPFTQSIVGYFKVGSDIPTKIVWDKNWHIHFDVPIHADGRLIGNLKLEHAIDAIKASLDSKNNFFDSEERLLYEVKDNKIRKCFSSKINQEKVIINIPLQS